MASFSRNETEPSSIRIGKVRVVARIRGFRDQELATGDGCSKCIVSAHKACDSQHSGKVKLSFDDQRSSNKNEYLVDHCYQQNEDNTVIFRNEIKPQVARVFDGESSTFIAFGARGGGKTSTIQGSEENLGLGILAVDEILKSMGGKHAIAVSVYEVYHNHVYDVLDSKNPEVKVLEDAQGKIMLKGLSKVRVNSIVEFQKLYYGGDSLKKSTQKTTPELPRRAHRALMIHVLPLNEGGKSKCVGKMNFVDLAGYENARRNSMDGTNFIEGTQINKSLNALLNVIYAVNANETRVPYRESKVARVLQDSLGGNNHISMIVCLNPSFCPDTVHALTLAARLKNVKPESVLVSSPKKYSTSRSLLSANKANSTSTTKKHTNSRLPLSAKKTNTVSAKKTNTVSATKTNTVSATKTNTVSAKKTNTALKARNLFDSIEEENVVMEQVPVMENNQSSVVKADLSDCCSTPAPYVEQLENKQEIMSLESKNEDVSVSSCTELIHHVKGDDNIEKENSQFPMTKSGSPSLTERLIELREKLIPLCSSTSLIAFKPQDPEPKIPLCSSTPLTAIKPQDPEPKTPITTHKLELSSCHSGTFSRHTSGMKQSLVKDYLQFLNSANKDDLKGMPGIGEKRASYILELREDSPEPFKNLDDLQEIGLSAKQVKTMMKKAAAHLFS